MISEIAGGEVDVVVVGAGPAGSAAAILLARQGHRVVLVDKARFPREKTCGCCLGARGARLMEEMGLGGLLKGATCLNRVLVRQAKRTISLRIPRGYALSRSELDGRLATAAANAGAEFFSPCSAKLLEADDFSREVELLAEGAPRKLRAKLVLACDGIRGTMLDGEPAMRWEIQPDAWMGVATTLQCDGGEEFAADAISMHVSDRGYVGAVMLGSGQVHLAAAMDPAYAKECGGPGRAMRRIIRENGGADLPQLESATMTGTPLLTRRRLSYGAQRVLAVGDACAYIEPFTGEGMTWAIESAALLAGMLPRDLAWDPQMPRRWTQLHRKAIGREQTVCRMMRYLLHLPRASRAASFLASVIPATGATMVRWMNRSAAGASV